jgi:hypothetical protein
VVKVTIPAGVKAIPHFLFASPEWYLNGLLCSIWSKRRYRIYLQFSALSRGLPEPFRAEVLVDSK